MRVRMAIWLLWLAALAISCEAQSVKYAGWDRFFYKFQLPIKAAAPDTQVRMSIYHSYPSTLHNVRVNSDSKAIEVSTRPAAIRALDPTLIQSMVLHVRLKDTRVGQSTGKLALSLSADELPSSKPVVLTIPLTTSAEKEVNEAMAVPVGRMEVTVGGLGRAGIYIYAALIVILLVWFVRRRARAA